MLKGVPPPTPNRPPETGPGAEQLRTDMEEWIGDWEYSGASRAFWIWLGVMGIIEGLWYLWR